MWETTLTFKNFKGLFKTLTKHNEGLDKEKGQCVGVGDPAATSSSTKWLSCLLYPWCCLRQPWPFPKSVNQLFFTTHWWRLPSYNLNGGEELPGHTSPAPGFPHPQLPHTRGAWTFPPGVPLPRLSLGNHTGKRGLWGAQRTSKQITVT